MLERHLPAKYKDNAPKLIAARRRRRRLDLQRRRAAERRPQRRRRSPAGGVRPRRRRRSRRCAPAASTVDERVRDMDANGVLGSLNFPSMPGFAGRLCAKLDDKDVALALLQAYNDWHIDEWCGSHPGRFIPLAMPAMWDPEVCGRGDAPGRREGMPGGHLLGEPGAAGLPKPAQRPLGPVLAGVQRRGHRRVHAHRLVVAGGDDRRRRTDQRDDHPAADEHRAGGGGPDVEPGAAEVPRPHASP